MNKKVLIGTACVFFIMLIVLGVWNVQTSQQNKMLGESAKIAVFNDGASVAEISLENLKQAGNIVFTANITKKVGDPVPHDFIGAEMSAVLENAGIHLSGKEKVLLTSVDNYSVEITAAEILDKNNVYIVYKMDAAPLAGTDQNGFGPYMVIIRKDTASTRWSKFLTIIEVI